MSALSQHPRRASTLRSLLAVGLVTMLATMSACDRRPADPTKPSTDSSMGTPGTSPGTSSGTSSTGNTMGTPSTGSSSTGPSSTGTSATGTTPGAGTADSTAMPPVAPVPSSGPQPSPSPASGTMR